MSNKFIYCWDTCVFIAWLKEESNKPLADIEIVASEIDAGEVVLIVSATIFTEMQRSKFTENQWDKFQDFLKRSNVVNANLTPEVAQRGGQIRDKAEKEGRKIKTGDAEIIATALAYGSDALHTFDPPIIQLNGSAIVEGLRITEPISLSGQKGLEGLL